MESLEVVVVFLPQLGMSRRQDDDEHGDDDITSDDVDQGVDSPILKILLGRENSVQYVPDNSSGSRTAMAASIVEDLSKSLADGQRPRMRGEDEDLVHQVHELLLPE